MADEHEQKAKISEAEKDELEEYFDSRRVVDQKHPDLGFRYTEDLEATSRGLDKLIRHPDVSAKVIGKYKLLLEQQQKFTRKRDDSKITRRKALDKIRQAGLWAVGLALSGGAVYKGVTTVVESHYDDWLKKELLLEATHTLALAPTAPSYAGWFAYYTKKEANVNYTESGIALAVSDGESLVGDSKSVLNETGFKLYKHQGKSGEIIPKLHIITQRSVSSSSSSETAWEEWVLRKTDDTNSPEIDPRVVVIEKRDSLLTQPLRFYLQISYLGNDRFGAKIMQRQPII